MKILLSSPVLSLDNSKANMAVIQQAARAAKNQAVDLLAFSEASLHGFEALQFDYQQDVLVALGLHSPPIAEMQHTAKQNSLGIAFGFYENYKGGLYSSYIVLGPDGSIVDLYRRASPGWKEAGACADYREGQDFHSFTFQDKELAVIICGDFFTDELLLPICDLDPYVDAFLWPVHVDYTVEEWLTANNDFQDPANVSKQLYAHRSSLLSKPVLFINSYVPEEGRAKGGLYHWQQGQEIASCEMGQSGSLLVEI